MAMLVKKELIGLPVETAAGIFIGKLTDIEIDAASHLVTVFHVRPSRILPGLIAGTLTISRQQVVSVTTKKIVVDDSLLKDKAEVWHKAPAANPGTNMSTLEE